ncbi:D-glycero-alpha-D-manno-heptose-1,7-bisphosphate 7-phosphatase [Roseococcus suduntuyensis]|uniref:D,D-heptose 1,7-bisphosphate phosphatase n=1 Tax=Roseococcus suduntuyensis TaxID=455361 RepID=A0A840AF03_9PROT|nr:HAD family hydrolase [Roseococcus suduntuyensis]MBB3898675.1 D,D-heptose 1,7-bisphosphate phosphatase [Roseococcus suduntuyensis]
MTGRRALFLDRDGVVNEDLGYVHRIEDFHFRPGIFELCRAARGLGMALVVVTNQSGIGRGMYSEEDFAALTAWMCARFAQEGAALDRVEHCPDVAPSRRRKPAPGMILDAAAALELDVAASVMVGDRRTDMAAAKAAGVGLRLLFPNDIVEVSDNCPRTIIFPVGSSLALAISFLSAGSGKSS